MARRPRISFKGAVYHVCFRGNARQRIFIDNRDRHRFLVSLAERIRDYQIRLYLYCLMVNHVHLLLETPCANISAFMEREHLQNVDVSWGHEPKIRKALEIKECMFRFMEREHLQNIDVSCGHEPGRATLVRAAAQRDRAVL